MQSAESGSDAALEAAKKLVEEKESAASQAEGEVAHWKSALQDAQQIVAQRERAWLDAGKPGQAGVDVAHSQQHFDICLEYCTELEKAAKHIRMELFYPKLAYTSRRLSAAMRQPWYVLSVIGGGAGFALFLLIAFLTIDDLLWNILGGVVGFIVGFIALARLQLSPRNADLQASLRRLSLLEQANTADLVQARKAWELATVKLEYDRASAWLLECRQALESATKRCEQARLECGQAREARSRQAAP